MASTMTHANRFLSLLIAAAALATAPASARGASAETLENENLRADFDDHGLASIRDKRLGKTLSFSADHWSFIIDYRRVDSRYLKAKERIRQGDRIRFLFHEGIFDVEVVYELKPQWRFLTKQLLVTNRRNDIYTVRHVDVFHGRFGERPKHIQLAGLDEKARRSRGLGDYAAFARMDDRWGAMLLVQNPFMQWTCEDGDFSMDYRADMTWKSEWGPFASDRACIGTYELTGQFSPAQLSHRGGWLLSPDWSSAGEPIDMGEIEAAIDCVRAFLLYRPVRSARIHVPWCENDYQINAASKEGEAQFKRIVDMAAMLGIQHMLYTVRNDEIARQEDDSDAWHWEHLLWLDQGIRIRKGQWDPKKDPLPQKTRKLMDYAESKHVKLMAYVYPTLAFEQNRQWLTRRRVNQDQLAANLGFRSFQDWLIDNLTGFMKNTGASGFAFDYWGLRSVGTSTYSQWYGTRRVLEQLRRREPEIVIDGRQSYQGYGPWTWLAGNYPHPTGGDEQPESFDSFPDLHFDRCSADQQRLTSYWYRNIQFCPAELTPGFITHQTARKNAAGDVPYDTDFNLRDWDYLGWKFSLFSSIATAPFSHCVGMIPARDEREFELFSRDAESLRFIRRWFDWTDKNADVLRKVRSIIGPPAIGCADGTAAIDGDHGFVFLFNPNHRKVRAEFALDESIGLTKGTRFLITYLYPKEGERIGAPGKAVFDRGDVCSLLMDGTTAWVLEVRPFQEDSHPLLFNVRGDARLEDQRLSLTQVTGEVGSTATAQALLPEGARVSTVTVNGRDASFRRQGRVVAVECRFAGEYFGRNQALTQYSPSFTGTKVTATLRIPQRVFDQLKRRRERWPIDWTEEDLQCTWLAPERLLLYIQIAEPDWRMDAGMTLDGKPIEVKKAYSSRTPGRLKDGKGHNTFTGFYADVSGLQPGRSYSVEVTLPSGLKPGQFQGLFFENVETEYTEELAE